MSNAWFYQEVWKVLYKTMLRSKSPSTKIITLPWWKESRRGQQSEPRLPLSDSRPTISVDCLYFICFEVCIPALLLFLVKRSLTAFQSSNALSITEYRAEYRSQSPA